MRVISFFFFLILLLCAIARAQHPHAEALDAEGAEEAEDEEENLNQQEPTLLEASELGEHEHRRELKRSPGPTPAPCTGTLPEDGAALCTFFDTLSASAQDQLISAGWTCDTLPADPCAAPGFRGVKCSGGRVSSLTVPPLRSGFEKFGPFVLVTEIGNLGCLKTLSLKNLWAVSLRSSEPCPCSLHWTCPTTLFLKTFPPSWRALLVSSSLIFPRTASSRPYPRTCAHRASSRLTLRAPRPRFVTSAPRGSPAADSPPAPPHEEKYTLSLTHAALASHPQQPPLN